MNVVQMDMTSISANWLVRVSFRMNILRMRKKICKIARKFAHAKVVREGHLAVKLVSQKCLAMARNVPVGYVVQGRL